MNAPIRIGIVGVGAAGRAFLPAIKKHHGFELAGIAEPVVEARESVATEMDVEGFADLPAMLDGARHSTRSISRRRPTCTASM